MTFSQQTHVRDLPLGDGVQVLASNEHGLVALDKPVGMLSHPNSRDRRERALLAADYDYGREVYTWKSGDAVCRAWLLNRLDSPTSGVLLLALSETIVPVIRRLFAEHKVRKTYDALVKQTPQSTAGCWRDSLNQDAYRNARVSAPKSEHIAQTYFQVMGKSGIGLPVSLIKLMPVTGRTHQLRIQCQHHRHPIVGDRTHGDFVFNRKFSAATGEKRMMLHSSETALSYRLHGKRHEFHAASAVPESFNRFVSPLSRPKKR